MIDKALSFTGHRPQSLPFGVEEMNTGLAWLETRLSEEIYRFAGEGYARFICGCAMGADIIFGEAVVAAKNDSFPDIKLVCAIPFPAQSASWPAFWRERYSRLLDAADEKVVVTPCYNRGCYHQRNRMMVDASTALLAVYNGSGSGGTAYTVKYARSHGREVVIIDPNEMRVKR